MRRQPQRECSCRWCAWPPCCECANTSVWWDSSPISNCGLGYRGHKGPANTPNCFALTVHGTTTTEQSLTAKWSRLSESTKTIKKLYQPGKMGALARTTDC